MGDALISAIVFRSFELVLRSALALHGADFTFTTNLTFIGVGRQKG
jgi:hypothetical protein